MSPLYKRVAQRTDALIAEWAARGRKHPGRPCSHLAHGTHVIPWSIAWRARRAAIAELPSDFRRDFLEELRAFNGRPDDAVARDRSDAAHERAFTRRKKLGDAGLSRAMRALERKHPQGAVRKARLTAIAALMAAVSEPQRLKTKAIARLLREQYPELPEAATDTLRKDIKAVKSGMRGTVS